MRCLFTESYYVLLSFIRILFTSLLLLTSLICQGAQIRVEENKLQQAIDSAAAGDQLLLPKGTYLGNFVLEKPLTLTGEKGTIIDADGKGNALLLKASNITLENLSIKNWGDDLTEQNAGIYSEGGASELLIQNNHIEGDGFGIWLQKSNNTKILNNTVVGNTELRSADRGNGIQLTSVTNSLVKGNDVSKVRDGLYVINSTDNLLTDNTMHHLRYGIHYMYSYKNDIIENHAYKTRAGYAMMNSRYLTIKGNTSTGSEDYGFLLNYIIHSEISENIVQDVWTEPDKKVLGRDGKAFFVYNAGYNTIANNFVRRAEIGIHLTAGSEYTKVYGNSFIDNPVQVKYVSNKKQEWSKDGSGNYWSNYLGWDMDNDTKGDVAFEPNDGIDKLLWQYPEMKILMSSPAILVLRWIQRQFPVLKPPGVKDSHPLMEVPDYHLVHIQPTDES